MCCCQYIRPATPSTVYIERPRSRVIEILSVLPIFVVLDFILLLDLTRRMGLVTGSSQEQYYYLKYIIVKTVGDL